MTLLRKQKKLGLIWEIFWRKWRFHTARILIDFIGSSQTFHSEIIDFGSRFDIFIIRPFTLNKRGKFWFNKSVGNGIGLFIFCFKAFLCQITSSHIKHINLDIVICILVKWNYILNWARIERVFGFQIRRDLIDRNRDNMLVHEMNHVSFDKVTNKAVRFDEVEDFIF